MRLRDLVLVLAAGLIVAGFATFSVGLGLLAAGAALIAGWFFLLDDLGGDE